MAESDKRPNDKSDSLSLSDDHESSNDVDISPKFYENINDFEIEGTKNEIRKEVDITKLPLGIQKFIEEEREKKKNGIRNEESNSSFIGGMDISYSDVYSPKTDLSSLKISPQETLENSKGNYKITTSEKVNKIDNSENNLSDLIESSKLTKVNYSVNIENTNGIKVVKKLETNNINKALSTNSESDTNKTEEENNTPENNDSSKEIEKNKQRKKAPKDRNPNILYHGKNRIRCNARIVVPYQPWSLVGSVSFIIVPMLYVWCDSLDAFKKGFNLHPAVFAVISAIPLILAVFFILYTGLMDPGIIPPIPFLDEKKKYINERNYLETIDLVKYPKQTNEKISTNLSLENEKNNNTNQSITIATTIVNESCCNEENIQELTKNTKLRNYGIKLNENLRKREDIQIIAPKVVFSNGYKFNHKYCYTCNVWRPLRSSHCGKDNTCYIKLDHYCVWLGTCVAARSYPYFLIMIVIVTAHISLLVFQAILTFIAHIVSFINDKNNNIIWTVGDHFKAYVPTIIILVVGIYMLQSISQLVHFHIYLIKNGITTKEDINGIFDGRKNPYNALSYKDNLYEIFRWLKMPSFLYERYKKRKVGPNGEGSLRNPEEIMNDMIQWGLMNIVYTAEELMMDIKKTPGQKRAEEKSRKLAESKKIESTNTIEKNQKNNESDNNSNDINSARSRVSDETDSTIAEEQKRKIQQNDNLTSPDSKTSPIEDSSSLVTVENKMDTSSILLSQQEKKSIKGKQSKTVKNSTPSISTPPLPSSIIQTGKNNANEKNQMDKTESKISNLKANHNSPNLISPSIKLVIPPMGKNLEKVNSLNSSVGQKKNILDLSTSSNHNYYSMTSKSGSSFRKSVNAITRSLIIDGDEDSEPLKKRDKVNIKNSNTNTNSKNMDSINVSFINLSKKSENINKSIINSSMVADSPMKEIDITDSKYSKQMSYSKNNKTSITNSGLSIEEYDAFTEENINKSLRLQESLSSSDDSKNDNIFVAQDVLTYSKRNSIKPHILPEKLLINNTAKESQKNLDTKDTIEKKILTNNIGFYRENSHPMKQIEANSQINNIPKNKEKENKTLKQNTPPEPTSSNIITRVPEQKKTNIDRYQEKKIAMISGFSSTSEYNKKRPKMNENFQNPIKTNPTKSIPVITRALTPQAELDKTTDKINISTTTNNKISHENTPHNKYYNHSSSYSQKPTLEKIIVPEPKINTEIPKQSKVLRPRPRSPPLTINLTVSQMNNQTQNKIPTVKKVRPDY